jgi:hypothetical protein
MADLRSALEEAMAQAESGELEAPVEKEIEVEEQDTIASEAQQDEKPRDEKGRFKSESEEQVESDAQEVQAEEPTDEVEEPVKPALARPTTWKKDYLPIWDKLTTGQQLTPEEALKLAEYSNQRESEYKKGVSAYKAEADNARALREAIEPFVPELQKNGIHPAAWINNLGRAHMILSNAPYQQKVEMFNKLAQDYGITINNSGEVVQPSQDPYTQQLMSQLQQMNQEVSTIKSRYEQEEQQRLMNEINRVAQDVERFPHFEELRDQMAQLLENGLASDLETAYAKAVRLNDDVWQQEQNRLLQQAKQEQAKAQKVAKAKAAAVSPKSVTPNGTVGNSGDKKDRRSLLAEKMGETDSRF